MISVSLPSKSPATNALAPLGAVTDNVKFPTPVLVSVTESPPAVAVTVNVTVPCADPVAVAVALPPAVAVDVAFAVPVAFDVDCANAVIFPVAVVVDVAVCGRLPINYNNRFIFVSSILYLAS